VSHHPALLQHHAWVLELSGDGGWTLHEAARYRWNL
jgi:hypothetical protein